MTLLASIILRIEPSYAATSSTLNFQGRLMTNTGGLVADGSYNIEFKIYDDPSAGTNWWTETRTGGSAVTVQNGYFSVNLGEVTPFGGTIPWDQELWMTMNVNSDGEMSPRFKLTAVPYAFRAGAVTDSAGNAFTGDDLIQKTPSTIQAVNSALSAIRLNQAGSGGILQLQGDGVDVFTVDKAGATVIGGGLTLGNSTLTTAGTIRWTGTDLEVYDGLQWVSLTAGGSSSITIDSNIKAYGKIEGSTGNALNISGASVVRNSTGNYTVTLNSALPDANYTIMLAVEEPGIDDGNIAVISQTTGGFTISTNIGDNGVGANVPTDLNWHFTVVDDANGSGADVFQQNGNAFGGTAILGTTDTFGLNLITDGNVAVSIDTTGEASFNNGLTVVSGNIDLNGNDIENSGNITGSGALTLASGGSGNLTLDSATDILLLADNTIRRSGSGTTTIDLQDAGGATTLSIQNSDGGQVANLLVEGGVTANTFAGSGVGLTDLSATNITGGTLNDLRLSSNVALRNANQTFTGTNTFDTGLILGNTAATNAGAVRFTGTDFEGYDGTQWVSLTSASSSSTPVTATFYDSTGGSTVTTAFSTINIDATLENSEPTLVGLASDEVTVTEAGYYQISYQVTATLAGGTRSGFNAKLQLDTGSGYADIAGSQAYHYGRLTTETAGTSTATVVLNLDAGDKVRIQGRGTSQSFTTVASASSLTITRVTASSSGGGGGGSAFEQGGNAFGAKALLGTTDAFGLDLVINGTAALAFDNSGAASFNNGLTITSGNLSVESGVIDSGGGLTIQSGAASDITFDSASGTIVFADDTLQFTAGGTLQFDLFDNSSSTLLQILNSSLTQEAGLIVEGGVTASNFSGSFTGNGSGLTNLNGSAISSGTISSNRLDSNVSLLDSALTFTSGQTFSDGLTLGNTTNTTAGTIRWTGTDFEGYDGIQWVSLTQSASVGSPLLDGVLAFGKVNGTTGALLSGDGASTVRNGTGDYTVTLDSAATTSNYIVQLTSEETGANLDDINITLDNQTTLGFDVDIREGDNSSTADVPIDKNWHFIVLDADAVAGGGGGGGGSAFEQGGNDFGATAVLGTTASNNLNLIVNSTTGLSLTTSNQAIFTYDVITNSSTTLGNDISDGLTIVSGDVTLANGLNFDSDTFVIDSANNRVGIGTGTTTNLLTINDATTADAAAQILLATEGTGNKGLVIQTSTGQTANALEIQNSTGSVLAGFDENGGLVLGLSTVTSSATINRSITLPDADGTICLSGSSSCGYVQFANGSYQSDASTVNTIAINKTNATGDLISLQRSGSSVFTVDNNGGLQIQSTQTTALDIRNAGGSSFFSVDTQNGIVRIGPATPDGNGTLLVLDTKNTAGDPTGTEGGIYYNSNLGKFRCYEAGAWKDCIGTRQVRSFVDTTPDAVVDANTTNYWDTALENNNTHPNLTPSSTVKSILGTVSVQISSTSNNDRTVVTRVERGVGSVPTCGSGTTVGFYASTFTTNSGDIITSTISFLDSPATTSQVYYTLCSDSNTSNAGGMTVDKIRVTLEEANNSN